MINVIYNDKKEIVKLKYVPVTHLRNSDSIKTYIRSIFENKHMERLEEIEKRYIEAFNQIQRIRGKLSKNDNDQKEIERLETIITEIAKKHKQFSNIENYQTPEVNFHIMKLNKNDKYYIKEAIKQSGMYTQTEVIEIKGIELFNTMETCEYLLNAYLVFEQSGEKYTYIYNCHHEPVKMTARRFKTLVKEFSIASIKKNNKYIENLAKIDKCKTAADVLKLF